ncbi:MAG TPA: septum formation protein Maf [Phycisphaerales bacterium]|nr:septum formation protein Maf [Phycisphaerales bacterium]
MTPTALPAGTLILASSSPRRRQLLAEAGLSFDVVAPTIAEPNDDLRGLSPQQQAEALAYFKARVVSDRRPDACVLGADTVVALGGEILGKPADEADARRMLNALSGSRHAVITGVAVLCPHNVRLIASETTYVTMRRMTPDEIDDYIRSDEWRGKAGAYAIQETADRYIVKVEGSFSNVVGLPMELVARMLAELRRRPEAHRAI